jgi:hypothetical protein
LWNALVKSGVPDVKGVWMSEVGTQQLVIVSIKQRYEGHARQTALLASQNRPPAYHGRYVIVVKTPQKEKKLLVAGTIVLAVGTMPVREIADRLRDRVPEIYLIGDGAGHHRIADAVYDGAIVASRI